MGISREPKSPLTELPYGLAGTVYRSALPFSRLFDVAGRLLDAYLAAEIDTIVMLTPPEEAQYLTGRDMLAVYHAQGLDVIQAPVADFSVPQGELFDDAVRQVLAAARSGENIVIHCHAGIGRTGIFAACLAKAVFGMEGDAAIAWVRRFIPGAVENSRQVAFVTDWNLDED